MQQIHRAQSSRSAALQIAIIHPLGAGIFCLFIWYALTAPELALAARLSSLMFFAVAFALLRVFVIEIAKGNAFETYLLSRRTLAIVRRGKPKRYIKPRDLAFFCPKSDSFILCDGKSLTLHVQDRPGSNRQFAERIITLWYGESEFSAAREAYRLSHFPPRGFSALLYGLLVAALTGVAIAGWYEHKTGLFTSLLALAVNFIVFTVRVHVQTVRFRWNLNDARACPKARSASNGASNRSASSIRRFPELRPSVPGKVLSYSALFLLASMTIPICRYLMYLPHESRREVVVAAFALVGVVFTLYLLGRCYNTFIRRDLFTTVLVSRRTISVVRVGKPVRYLKQRDIVAIRPNPKIILLADGTELRLGYNDQLGNCLGLFDHLWRAWWEYVPEFARRGPADAGVGWLKAALFLGVFVAGLAMAFHSEDTERDWLMYPGVAALLIAPCLFFWTVLRHFSLYCVSLKPEDYAVNPQRQGRPAS